VELPRLEPLYQKYREQGLEILAIEATRNEKMAKDFIEKNSLTYHFVQDGQGDKAYVRNTFGIRGFPTSFLVDRNGKVLYSHLGFSPGDEEKLEKEIKGLL
jgi:peroxiredoxin